MYVYTIELEDGHWYVGSTEKPPERLEQHRSGNGSAWTSRHSPVGGFSTLELVEGGSEEARLKEDFEVKRLMQKHGIERVRGGSYSSLVLSVESVRALERELRHADDVCLRCGRTNHWIEDCYATYDTTGQLISDDDETDSDSNYSCSDAMAEYGSSDDDEYEYDSDD